MIKLNLYLPMFIVTLFMSIFTVFSVIYFQENAIYENKIHTPKEFMKSLDQKVNNEASILGEYIDFIQSNKDITKLFTSLNKKELNNSILPIYKRLNKNVELTHLYFIRTDGVVLLRVHDYQRDGDIIDRVTFKKSMQQQSLFYGLEFGPKKNYTLRVVKPWIVNKKLIGYIELGKEIDKLINEFSLSSNTQIYLAVNKSVYKNSSAFVKEQLAKKVKTDNCYIVYNTFIVPTQINSILNNSLSSKNIDLDNKKYFISKGALSDVSGKNLGWFIFLSDVSLEHELMINSIKINIVRI